IANLRNATGAKKVTILAHSMGGLASRAYIENEEAQDVDRLITIGTPHGGTPLASVLTDPALAGTDDLVFQGLKQFLKAGSPADQEMSSSPGVPQQSGALHLLNETRAP